jgi:hypothetical protein
MRTGDDAAPRVTRGYRRMSDAQGRAVAKGSASPRSTSTAELRAGAVSNLVPVGIGPGPSVRGRPVPSRVGTDTPVRRSAVWASHSIRERPSVRTTEFK